MPKNPRIGTYVKISTAGEVCKAYVPAPLPFYPPLDMGTLAPHLDEANRVLGMLSGITEVLPDTSLLLYFFVRKEALISSQIEGTQSSLDDLLLYESDQVPGVPVDDVEEVSRYIAAMQYGLKKIREGYPISLRLVKELQSMLLRGGRGSKKSPGEFRRSQNWIGGTRPGNAIFVPPPPEKLMECMGNWELYINDEFGKVPTLLKAAISHVQFETIHPFLDGNGRTGRLLIALILCAEGMLPEPVLYLSLHFKKHRKTYYELLNRVREDKAGWEVWTEFFLTGLIEAGREAMTSARQITALFADDLAKIKTLKRASPNALKAFEYLQRRALVSIPNLAKAMKVSQPTATAVLHKLAELGIVAEVSGKKRDRMFAYQAYLDILKQGTEPL
ncbi:MAG: Fic family protein [Rickettsiales bacterium]